MKEQLLHASEIASRLSISVATAYRWMRAGVLPVVRFAGARSIRVSEKALEHWIEANTTIPGDSLDPTHQAENSTSRGSQQHDK
jgi:excisionase family DNA binding protein